MQEAMDWYDDNTIYHFLWNHGHHISKTTTQITYDESRLLICGRNMFKMIIIIIRANFYQIPMNNNSNQIGALTHAKNCVVVVSIHNRIDIRLMISIPKP